MSKPAPCYRICLWDANVREWRPVITRTRNLLRHVRCLKARGWRRSDVHIERRPGKGVPMPFPDPKGSGVKLHVA